MTKVKLRKLPSNLLLLLLALLLTFSTTTYAQDEAEAPAEAAAADLGGDPEAGKALFNANCAACHKLYKRAVGPALYGVGDKYEKEWLYAWIKNSQELIKSGDSQAIAIYEEYNQSVMQAFPQLSNEDIDNIIAYTYTPKPEPVEQVATGGGGAAGGSDTGATNNIILAALALVFLLLVVMLVLVSKTLKRIAEANGVVYEEEQRTPIWKAFVQNQFLVLVTSVFLLLVAGYFAYGWMMQVGVDQGYAPVQPIHYSHKIHAGYNQIDCNYCHSSARKSKHSGIPSLNVCMNCHKSIAEYNGEEDLENGYTKEFYTGEIKKLYD